MKKNCVPILIVVSSFFLNGGVHGEEPNRLESLVLTSPFYCIVDEIESFLLITPTTTEALDLDIRIYGLHGDPLPLGSFSIEPRKPLRVDLRELLGNSGPNFEAGSVEISFFGRTTDLEAWTVMRDRSHAVQWRFEELSSEPLAREMFWDTTTLPEDHRPTLRLSNGSDQPRMVTLKAGRNHKEVFQEILEVPPRSVLSFDPMTRVPGLKKGWLHMTADGSELQALGWYGTDSRPFLGLLSTTAIFIPSEEASDEEAGLRISEPFTFDPQTSRSEWPFLTFFHPGKSPTKVEVRLVRERDGQVLAQRRTSPGSRTVEHWPLARLAGKLTGSTVLESERLRFEIHGPTTVVVQGGSVEADVFRPMQILDADERNATGIYALPSLERYGAVNRIVNLGNEPTPLNAEVFWDGGSLQLDPIELAPGAGVELNLEDAIAAVDPEGLANLRTEPLFLQWLGRSPDLLDHLSLKDRAGGSIAALRYQSCCRRNPVGSLEPSTGVLDFGASETLRATERSDTCTGSSGPFLLNSPNLSFSSPLSWNGSTAVTNTDVSQRVSFSATSLQVEVSSGGQCVYEIVPVSDSGPVFADSCRAENHPDPDFDPARSCASQTSFCGACFACCELEKEVRFCNCEETPGSAGTFLCKEGVRATCRTTCTNTCKARFNLNCPSNPECA